MNEGRGRRRLVALVLALLLLGAAFVLTVVLTHPGTPIPAPGAATAQTDDPLLHVVQTSTMAGLAPGVAPVAISGRVVNDGANGTFVTDVEVEITSVTTKSDSPDGPCVVSDYQAVDVRMPVGRTLAPGGSASFAGASIGFRAATHNQDACQGATVHLRYTAHHR